MAFSRLVLLLLLSVSCYASNVPVFIWGEGIDRLIGSPLNEISAPEFRDIVQQELDKDPLLVVFVEETLSVEDLSLKGPGSKTAFSYLHSQLDEASYLPMVENPLDVIYQLPGAAEAKNIQLTGNALPKVELENYDGKIIFISLKDASAGESRWDLLRRHDNLMEKALSILEDKHKVVACYTARYASWTTPESLSRTRRQAGDVTATGEHTFNGLRLYVSKFWLSDGTTNTDLGVPSATSVFNETLMNTTLEFSTAKLTLNFHQAGGYWFFDTVTLENPADETLYPTSEVYALMGFSYRCMQNVTFATVNDTKQYTVTFQDFKAQPFFTETNATNTPPFGDSFNCVGFFSAPIWSGLFVVFILLAITFYGIMMMMDIRTMDRFDDPKGKTITINAVE